MVKILNCYLYSKKVMALCLRVQFFLANPIQSNVWSVHCTYRQASYQKLQKIELQVHMLSSLSLFSTVFIILVLCWEDTNYKLNNFEHSPSLRCCTEKCTYQPCNV